MLRDLKRVGSWVRFGACSCPGPASGVADIDSDELLAFWNRALLISFSATTTFAKSHVNHTRVDAMVQAQVSNGLLRHHPCPKPAPQTTSPEK